jgi:hypothetical protein
MALRVDLRFVTPAMRLARPIVDDDGRLVAGAGTHLREGVVRVLRQMAVQTVLVVDSGEVPAWETVRPLDEELRALEARLGPQARTGALAELAAAIARRLTARAAELASDPGIAAPDSPPQD